MTFAPGASGNPGGRRGEKPFRDALMLALRENEDEPADSKRDKLRAIARKLVDAAMNGEAAAIKEVADRCDGKPPQSHDIDANLRRGPLVINK